jgi:predicted anti-sigma-YlaC factor YlaD
MNCEQARQAWHTRLENALPNADLERHLAECVGCGRYAAQMEAVTGALGALRRETESVRSDARLARSRRPRLRTGLTRIAAVIAISIGAYVTFWLWQPRTVERVPIVKAPPVGVDRPIEHQPAVAPRVVGITLRGESAKTLLAVATPSQSPEVAMYWLYPTLSENKPRTIGREAPRD